MRQVLPAVLHSIDKASVSCLVRRHTMLAAEKLLWSTGHLHLITNKLTSIKR